MTDSKNEEPRPEAGSENPSAPPEDSNLQNSGENKTAAGQTESEPAEPKSNIPPSQGAPKPGQKTHGQRLKGCLRGCMLYIVAPIILAIIGLIAYGEYKNWREAENIRAEGKAVADQLMEASDPQYDVDETIRMMHDLDILIEQDSSTYMAYLENSKAKTFNNIAPEVAEARGELINKMTDLYSSIEAEEDREMIFSEYRNSFEYFSSIISLSNGILPVSFDKDQAGLQLERYWTEQSQKAENLEVIREKRIEYLDELENYYTVYRKYHTIWDEFCRVRDDAYLHIDDGEWDQAMESLDKALEISPMDKESRLLKARVLIGQSQESEFPEPQLAEAEEILDELLDDSSEYEAAVLMMQGVIHTELEDFEAAQDAFQLASTRFENQIERYADSASLYDMRGYLRSSPEGLRIIRNFKAMIQGAGFYSPELQRMRVLDDFALGPNEEVKETVLYHFRSRIAQEQRVKTNLDDTVTLFTEEASRIESPSIWFSIWNRAKARANYNRALRLALTPISTDIHELHTVDVLENLVIDLEYMDEHLDPANKLITKDIKLVCEFNPSDITQDRVKEKLKLDEVALALMPEAILDSIQNLVPSHALIRIENDSENDLTNVALIIQVRYTDMNKGENAYFLFPRTSPTLPTENSRTFGEVNLAYVHSGKEKTVADIVSVNGIIITDQGVGMIDGGIYENEEIEWEEEIEKSILDELEPLDFLKTIYDEKVKQAGEAVESADGQDVKQLIDLIDSVTNQEK